MAVYSFWRWFFLGKGGDPGYLNYLDKYLLLHIFVAFFAALRTSTTLKEAACSLMLPISGLFFGVTFAWSGNITALLSTDELEELSGSIPGGLEEYVYISQSVVLVVLLSAVGWGLAGLSIISAPEWYFPLFFLSSIAVRECWNLIIFAQYLTLARKDVATANRKLMRCEFLLEKMKDASNQSNWENVSKNYNELISIAQSFPNNSRFKLLLENAEELYPHFKYDKA